jgi:hypothetical protein
MISAAHLKLGNAVSNKEKISTVGAKFVVIKPTVIKCEMFMFVDRTCYEDAGIDK